MSLKTLLQEAAIAPAALPGYVDLIGLVAVMVPVVHRVNRLIKDLEPRLQELLTQEVELRSEEIETLRADRATMIELQQENRQNQEALIRAVELLDQRVARFESPCPPPDDRPSRATDRTTAED